MILYCCVVIRLDNVFKHIDKASMRVIAMKHQKPCGLPIKGEELLMRIGAVGLGKQNKKELTRLRKWTIVRSTEDG